MAPIRSRGGHHAGPPRRSARNGTFPGFLRNVPKQSLGFGTRYSETSAPFLAGLTGLVHTMTEESTVNGVWASILCTYYFPFPEYIIKPERRLGFGKNKRVDLAVTRARDGAIIDLFEGKGSSNCASFDSAVGQLNGYFDAADDAVEWGIAAIGRKVVLVMPEGPDLLEVKMVADRARTFKGRRILDIKKDSGEIDVILKHFKAKTVGDVVRRA